MTKSNTSNYASPASSGLGFAVALQMAQRGARVIMACRSGIPGKGEEVRKITGNPNVGMVHQQCRDGATAKPKDSPGPGTGQLKEKLMIIFLKCREKRSMRKRRM